MRRSLRAICCRRQATFCQHTWFVRSLIITMAEKLSEELVKSGKSGNFLRQFRDIKTREFKKITAGQFMDVWNHYDEDGRI